MIFSHLRFTYIVWFRFKCEISMFFFFCIMMSTSSKSSINFCMCFYFTLLPIKIQLTQLSLNRTISQLQRYCLETNKQMTLFFIDRIYSFECFIRFLCISNAALYQKQFQMPIESQSN